MTKQSLGNNQDPCQTLISNHKHFPKQIKHHHKYNIKGQFNKLTIRIYNSFKYGKISLLFMKGVISKML